MRIRAAVLHEPRQPLVVEEVELAPPRDDEVLVRVVAAGVCHSDVRLADGELGEGRWPMVLGHEGAGVVEAVGAGVTHVAPGDHVGFCIVPACRACDECRAGRFHLCLPAGENGPRGVLTTARRDCRLPDGTSLQHALMTACFAERTRSSRLLAPSRSRPSFRSGRPSLLGCGVVTAFGAVRNVARVRPGESAAVIGCGGVGLQVVAALHLAGASPIVAVDLDPAKLELALARGATARASSPGSATTAAARDTDHGTRRRPRLRGRRPPETMRLAWDCLRPGRNRGRRRPRRRRTSTSRFPRSSSSPTRRSAARTTAPATPRAISRGSRSSRSPASSISRASSPVSSRSRP